AAFSAAVCAAKGVLFREPLKPTLPALAQEMTFPILSVRVTMVLLKVAWTWASPVRTSLRSRLRPPLRGAAPGFSSASATSLPPLLLGPGRRRRHRLLLDHDALAPALARPGVGVGPLPADGQPAPVANASVAAHVHEPLDVHGHLAPEVALDLEVALDDVPD